MAYESGAVPRIGRYHLVAELARGGMGRVLLAASHGPGGFSKLHALKELKAGLCDDETYVAMFLEEARLAARLIHPNVVQTNEVASEDGRHFMVMEFLDGRSLQRIGRRLGGRFPVGAHLRVIAEALLGLHYVHELRGFDGEALGIVHRDVSPLNLFVTFNGQAKVLDFGVAKAESSALDTKNGIVKGRIAYMAPEQANGDKVDRRADIWGPARRQNAAKRRTPRTGTLAAKVRSATRLLADETERAASAVAFEAAVAGDDREWLPPSSAKLLLGGTADRAAPADEPSVQPAADTLAELPTSLCRGLGDRQDALEARMSVGFSRGLAIATRRPG